MNECYQYVVECAPFPLQGKGWGWGTVLFADRGFTGHEHLTQFGLINMNGRLYDPLVGRFLSPDNYVQSPGLTQGYNRYSYCLNNPLRYTDPSGDNPALVSAGIFAAFVYLKGAYDNRDMETGKWAWNPASWFGKGKTGVVVGVNTNTDFTSMNYYAGLYSPDFSPALSYSPNYGLGLGDVTTPGSSSFYYPSYNPPSAESVVNKFISNANKPNFGGEVYAYNPGTISPYEPNIFERFSTSVVGKSIIGRALYGVIDDAWVTSQCFTIGHNNAFHLSGAYATGNETVNSGINTMTNFVPMGNISSYLGIGRKTLNAGQFNSMMKGTGITAAQDGGAQILRYNNVLRQSTQFNKMWNIISPASSIIGYW